MDQGGHKDKTNERKSKKENVMGRSESILLGAVKTFFRVFKEKLLSHPDTCSQMLLLSKLRQTRRAPSSACGDGS